MAKRARVDPDVCVGCELCTQLCPEVFRMEDDLAVAGEDDCENCDLEDVASQCPVEAISVE